MKSETNTKSLLKKSLLLASLSLISCKGFEITKGEVCKEIPFIDAPEGACSTNIYPPTVRIVPPSQWHIFRQEAIMISPEFWTEIKKNWLKACRKDSDCVKQLESIDDVIQKLDQLTKKVIKP